MLKRLNRRRLRSPKALSGMRHLVYTLGKSLNRADILIPTYFNYLLV